MTIHQGDALTVLRTLPDSLVHCCITSPPYWGLRDYGTASWEGGDLECKHLAPARGGRDPATSSKQLTSAGTLTYQYERVCENCGARRIDQQIGLESTPSEYVAKMVDVFREVRRVLRDDGTLWLNLGDSYASGKGTCYNPGGNTSSLNVHLKANNVHPLDRGNKSTLSAQGLKPKDLVGIPWRVALALQADGWYWRDTIVWHKPAPMPESVRDRCTKSWEPIFMFAKSERYYFDAAAIAEPSATEWEIGQEKRISAVAATGGAISGGVGDRVSSGNTRNKRNVWTLPPMATPDAHFATFPLELPETCLLAGCPPDGTVLDPFAGAGTVGLACLKHGRGFLGIELNQKYIEIARTRAGRHMPLLMDPGPG